MTPTAFSAISANGQRPTPHVVILGGGFGGLYAAKALERAPARDVDRKLVKLTDSEIAYDYLIIATGATHSYFNHPEWESDAPGLKTIEDALEIRRRVLLAFEAAERETDRDAQQAWLTFVIIGGGPTGVELAGALSEIARHTMMRDFRTINPSSARIVLIEGKERVLPTYPLDLSKKAEDQLRGLGVDVITSAMVTSVDERSVGAAAPAARRSLPRGRCCGRRACRRRR